MRYTKFVATAFIAAAATGVAAGTSYAAPADPAPVVQDQQAASQVKGSQQGVDYVVQLAQDHGSIVTQVTGGRFTVDAATKSMELRNDEGAVVTKLNLSSMVGDQKVDLAAAVDNDGRQLTLTPINAPITTAKDISSQDWFFSELQHAALGGVIGALVGALFFGIGLPFGALIGLLIAGGQPLIDSGSAYFSGQP